MTRLGDFCVLLVAIVALTNARELSLDHKNRLIQWMNKIGAKLHPGLEIASFGNGQGLGVVTRRPISPGQLLFTIPARIAISARSADDSLPELKRSLAAAGDCPFDLQVRTQN